MLIFVLLLSNFIVKALSEQKPTLDPNVVNRIKTVSFTVESYAIGGAPCMTDCVDGECVTGWNNVERCIVGKRKAATYYTSQYYTNSTTCMSKCGTFGYSYRWCIVDSSYKWDYCNSDTERHMQLRAYTKTYGPCANKCDYYGESSTRCRPLVGKPSWDYCYVTEYYYELIYTRLGTKCRGICAKHGNTKYFWCVDENLQHVQCAPLAVYYSECQSCNHALINLFNFPNEMVLQYAERMERDATYITTQVNNATNPVLQYTYRPAPNANSPMLPLVVRARIESRHIRVSNSRGSEAISAAARLNCQRMGMNTNRPNRNNDAVGHLISYKNGGPADVYNFAPQSSRLNLGLVNVGNIYNPSIWAASEREVTDWVSGGHGYVDLVVVVVYDENSTRPMAFGISHIYYRMNGQVAIQCPSYWLSNDPGIDPDCFNH